MVIDKAANQCQVIDTAIPYDGNIRSKEMEKLEKYQPLREELSRIWKLNVEVVTVVVEALGTLTALHTTW